MDIELSINDKDIENGIATWLAHRTKEAIDHTLTTREFTCRVEEQVRRQIEPMFGKIVVELSQETVQKYANRYIETYMQTRVREVVKGFNIDDPDKIEAIVRKALIKAGK